MIQWYDIVRSVTLGWAAVLVILVPVYSVLSIALAEEIRPGAFLGILLRGVSGVLAITYIMIKCYDHLGAPPDTTTWLAVGAISLGCLSHFLLCAHIVLHNECTHDAIMRWFSNRETSLKKDVASLKPLSYKG